MNIRFLGAHNCESSTIKLVTLLIDDTLAIEAVPVWCRNLGDKQVG